MWVRDDAALKHVVVPPGNEMDGDVSRRLACKGTASQRTGRVSACGCRIPASWAQPNPDLTLIACDAYVRVVPWHTMLLSSREGGIVSEGVVHLLQASHIIHLL